MSKILVIEDDKFLVRVYGSQLKKLGIDATLLEEGTTAVQVAKEEKPALIVLDLILPKKSGVEVIQELKSDPETKDIPVIVVSALGGEEDIRKLKGLGAVDYLVKATSSFKEVTDAINKYLAK